MTTKTKYQVLCLLAGEPRAAVKTRGRILCGLRSYASKFSPQEALKVAAEFPETILGTKVYGIELAEVKNDT